jgi:pectate lyase
MNMFFKTSPWFRCPTLCCTVFFISLLTLSFSQVRPGWALPAFPGAEGFGTQTRGGRGGVVMVVTTLNGSGPGSFREAMLTTRPRIIVFRVSGVIDLGGDITLTEAHSNVTVLGQSSPGSITFINGSIGNYHTNFHDAIFRFIRIRAQAGDTIAFNPVYNLVIDHSDFSGGSDETFDIDASHDVTVQWSTILNSMSGSGSQNYGALIAYRPTNNMTFHHNFSAHHLGRCGAQFHWGGSGPVPSDGVKLDLRNNIFYNCGFQQIYRADVPPAEGTNFNLIGNYAKSGPNTPAGSMLFGLDGRIYMNDNVYPGQSIMSIYSNPTYLSQPHPFPSITTNSAVQAYDDVLNWAGSWPRDAMTTRTVNEARTGTGTLGKLNDPLNTATGPAPATDADLDGIADSWELAHGLSPSNPLDSAQLHSSGYAHVEVYLNEIARQIIQRMPPSPPTGLTVQ